MKWELDILFFGTKKKRNRGLFKPAKHKWIANIITFESPAAARATARKLVTYVRTGYNGRVKIGRQRTLQILRALNYAANRAEAAAKNPRITAETRRELKQISKIYRDAAETVSKMYKRRYG